MVTNIGRDCGFGSGHSVVCGSDSKGGDYNSDIDSCGIMDLAVVVRVLEFIF